MNCPKCGSNKGFYTKGTFYQYYDSDGEPCGYENDTESMMARCRKCNKQIKLSRLIEEREKKYALDN